MKKTSGKKIIFVVIKYAVVLLITISMVVPFIWMLSASFKANLEVFEFPIRWIPETIHFENYTNVWDVALVNKGLMACPRILAGLQSIPQPPEDGTG